jgi:hypothetical protein
MLAWSSTQQPLGSYGPASLFVATILTGLLGARIARGGATSPDRIDRSRGDGGEHTDRAVVPVLVARAALVHRHGELVHRRDRIVDVVCALGDVAPEVTLRGRHETHRNPRCIRSQLRVRPGAGAQDFRRPHRHGHDRHRQAGTRRSRHQGQGREPGRLRRHLCHQPEHGTDARNVVQRTDRFGQLRRLDGRSERLCAQVGPAPAGRGDVCEVSRDDRRMAARASSDPCRRRACRAWRSFTRTR